MPGCCVHSWFIVLCRQWSGPPQFSELCICKDSSLQPALSPLFPLYCQSSEIIWANHQYLSTWVQYAVFRKYLYYFGSYVMPSKYSEEMHYFQIISNFSTLMLQTFHQQSVTYEHLKFKRNHIFDIKKFLCSKYCVGICNYFYIFLIFIFISSLNIIFYILFFLLNICRKPFSIKINFFFYEFGLF